MKVTLQDTQNKQWDLTAEPHMTRDDLITIIRKHKNDQTFECSFMRPHAENCTTNFMTKNDTVATFVSLGKTVYMMDVVYSHRADELQEKRFNANITKGVLISLAFLVTAGVGIGIGVAI